MHFHVEALVLHLEEEHGEGADEDQDAGQDEHEVIRVYLRSSISRAWCTSAYRAASGW